jgi:hypothetical protein
MPDIPASPPEFVGELLLLRSPSLFDPCPAAAANSEAGSGVGIETASFTSGVSGFGAILAFGLAAPASLSFAGAFAFGAGTAIGFVGAGFAATDLGDLAETGAADFAAVVSLDSSSLSLASARSSFCRVFLSFALSFFFFITQLLY